LYCKNCLSLRIIEDDVAGDYCPDCGCADIGEMHIEDWLKLYKEKYGTNF
jgi:hypothetical protein